MGRDRPYDTYCFRLINKICPTHTRPDLKQRIPFNICTKHILSVTRDRLSCRCRLGRLPIPRPKPPTLNFGFRGRTNRGVVGRLGTRSRGTGRVTGNLLPTQLRSVRRTTNDIKLLFELSSFLQSSQRGFILNQHLNLLRWWFKMSGSQTRQDTVEPILGTNLGISSPTLKISNRRSSEIMTG